MVETSGMVLWTFYRVPEHISRSNLKFQTQLPTADPTIAPTFALRIAFHHNETHALGHVAPPVFARSLLFATPSHRGHRHDSVRPML